MPASPLAFPPPPPRCPATTRHAPRYGTGIAGLQCHYEPGHDGDHAAYPGPGEGDIFWPQEAEAASRRSTAVAPDSYTCTRCGSALARDGEWADFTCGLCQRPLQRSADRKLEASP